MSRLALIPLVLAVSVTSASALANGVPPILVPRAGLSLENVGGSYRAVVAVGAAPLRDGDMSYFRFDATLGLSGANGTPQVTTYRVTVTPIEHGSGNEYEWGSESFFRTHVVRDVSQQVLGSISVLFLSAEGGLKGEGDAAPFIRGSIDEIGARLIRLTGDRRFNGVELLKLAGEVGFEIHVGPSVLEWVAVGAKASATYGNLFAPGESADNHPPDDGKSGFFTDAELYSRLGLQIVPGLYAYLQGGVRQSRINVFKGEEDEKHQDMNVVNLYGQGGFEVRF